MNKTDDDPGMTVGQPKLLYQGKWLKLSAKNFTDRLGHAGEWTYVERVIGRQAVAIIATTRQTGSLVVIRQFRIPLEAWVWEFPAGLVDEGEAIDQAAWRELQEETGYDGSIVAISQPGVSSPGLSTEEIHLVHMTCPEAAGPHARESSEAIEVHLIAPGAAADFLARTRQSGDMIDAKLLAYLLAISWCGKA